MSERNERVVVLYSGGLDSTTLLYWCKEKFAEVYPLYINYGSSHRELEYAAALATCETLGLTLETAKVEGDIFKRAALTDASVEMPSNLSETINVVVPFRNLMFMTLGAAYADAMDAGVIATSPTKEDFEVFRDCRREFYDHVEKTLAKGSKYENGYTIITPFITNTKAEVIQAGMDLNVDFSKTWTCYNPQKVATPVLEGGDEVVVTPCGVCPSCQVRNMGFAALNIIDPLVG